MPVGDSRITHAVGSKVTVSSDLEEGWRFESQLPSCVEKLAVAEEFEGAVLLPPPTKAVDLLECSVVWCLRPHPDTIQRPLDVHFVTECLFERQLKQRFNLFTSSNRFVGSVFEKVGQYATKWSPLYTTHPPFD